MAESHFCAITHSLPVRFSALSGLVNNDFFRDAGSKRSQYSTSVYSINVYQILDWATAAAIACINSMCPRFLESSGLVDNDFCRDAGSKKSHYVSAMTATSVYSINVYHILEWATAATIACINSLCPRFLESSWLGWLTMTSAGTPVQRNHSTSVLWLLPQQVLTRCVPVSQNRLGWLTTTMLLRFFFFFLPPFKALRLGMTLR